MTPAVRLREGPTGRGLFAVADLPPGIEVARFEGPVVPWERVPAEEIRHALLVDGRNWMLPRGEARFLNHSCAPNCGFGDGLDVRTLRSVAAGEELTIAYDAVAPDDGAFLDDPALSFWDPRWTFACRCGAPACRGVVDGYVLRERAR